MMKVQDVLLKAMAKRISWWAAEILGVTDRTMRRWRERLEKDGLMGAVTLDLGSVEGLALFKTDVRQLPVRRSGFPVLPLDQPRVSPLRLERAQGSGKRRLHHRAACDLSICHPIRCPWVEYIMAPRDYTKERYLACLLAADIDA